MTQRFDIRPTTPADRAGLLEMYPLAFPDEDLRGLVQELLDEPSGILSLAGFDGHQLVAHVMLTDVQTAEGGPTGALLGPLAVRPSYQRQGWGRDIVAQAEARARQSGVQAVYLLGDPQYYSKLGYAQEKAVMPPYPLPHGWDYAWQSHLLGKEHLAPGNMSVPAPWQVPAYWAE